MSLIEAATCRIIIERKSGGEEKGTGFFIDRKRILTCNHVLPDDPHEISISKIGLIDQRINLTAKVIDQCPKCDFAILEIKDEFQNENILDLCDSLIIKEENIEIFGYPNTQEGQKIGKELIGNISRHIIDSSDSIHDIILNIPSYSKSENYKAFSGSPIVNNFGQVIGILKYRDEQHLAAVSIKKAVDFIEKHEIKVKPDQLQSFDVYGESAFTGFENMQSECEIESKVPIEKSTPQDIIESKRGTLFYPNRPQTISELIQLLRKSKDLNTKLWKGWVQLLTYVEILKGNNANINSISIDIPSSELVKRFGVYHTSKKIMINLHLNFYFTEEESYFNIAKKSIHQNIKTGFTNHTCNIFNSNIEDFGNINKYIPDISSPESSGPSISKLKIGALSLSQLNREVKSSNTLQEVSKNLKNIFKNAIN